MFFFVFSLQLADHATCHNANELQVPVLANLQVSFFRTGPLVNSISENHQRLLLRKRQIHPYNLPSMHQKLCMVAFSQDLNYS